jgi:short-subunit dehydrogenase
MKTIRGKRAVITGAAGGIGRAIALALAAEGADLHLLDIDDVNLAGAVAEARKRGADAAGSHCDLARPQEISAAIEAILKRWGHVDILVNNAGVAYYGPTERMTAGQCDWLLGVNLLAPIQFIRELLPVLLERQEAHILNVCSVGGLVAIPKIAAYHATKFAMVGFSSSLRAEYVSRGLGVTALCPGIVRTNILSAAAKGQLARPIPVPPRWLTTSPEYVAAWAVKAICRNQALVVIPPLGKALWVSQRLFPGLVGWLFRSRKIRRPWARFPRKSRTVRLRSVRSTPTKT